MPAGRAPLRRRRPGGAPPAEAGTRECDVGPRTAGEVYGDRGAGPNRGQGGTVHRARSSPVDQIYRDRRRVPGRIRAMFWSGLSVLLLTGWLGAIPPAAQWPVDPPVILQAFAAPATDYGPGHRGLDLAVRPGDEIRAPLPGVIGFVGSVAGTPIVAIDHPDGLRTTYEPADAAAGRHRSRRRTGRRLRGGWSRPLRIGAALPALGSEACRRLLRPRESGDCGGSRATSGGRAPGVNGRGHNFRRSSKIGSAIAEHPGQRHGSRVGGRSCATRTQSSAPSESLARNCSTALVCI
jgi:hypothetical protein